MASILETINAYLPQHEGLLPKWLLLVSIVSIGNSLQAYLTLSYTSRIYSENPSLPQSSSSKSPPSDSPSPKSFNAYPHPLAPNTTVTPLSARTFGTWTLIQSIVRLYCAYNVSNPQIYQMAGLTYAVAWLHFMSEWFVFKTAKWGAPLAGPVFVANGTLVWMALQWGYYVN